ncbi:MAG TPA: ABC transporter permease [Gemmatimonadales bacterium]|nr:ABC transporter permease [Gemmatimonadales bacterium]
MIRAPWRSGVLVAVVLTLALAIGANTALYSVVHGVLLRPLPFAAPDRVVLVSEFDRISGTTREPFSIPDYYDLRARTRAFSALAGFASRPYSLSGDEGEPEQIVVTAVSAGYFGLLGVEPLRGRVFAAAEDQPGGPRVALLGEALWRRRFAADPGVVGRTVQLDGEPYVVVGVASAAAELPGEGSQVWLPLQLGPTSQPRSLHNVRVLGRLAPDASLGSAGADAAALAARLEADFPADNRGRGMVVERAMDVTVGAVRPALWLVLGAVGLLLLVACVNVANLLLARAWTRAGDLAVRRALGASGIRLAREFLVEGLLVALAGAALGLLVATWGVDLLLGLAPADIPRLDQVRIDGGVLAATLAVALATGLAFGALPLLQSRGIDPAIALHGGGRGMSAGPARRRLRQALVVAQLALAVVLVAGAGLLLRSFARLRATDPGFRTEQVLTAGFTLPASRYPQRFDQYPVWPEVSAFYARLLERLRGIPGVRAAALDGNHPLAHGFTNSFVIVGRENEYAEQPEIAIRTVSPEYFGVVGVPLVQGRLLDARDAADAPDAILLNQAAVRRFFPRGDALGARITFWGRERTVVGIVGDERFHGVAEAAPPALYPALAQSPIGAATLLVATGRDPAALAGPVRSAMQSVDAAVALSGVEPLAVSLADSLARPRFTSALLAVFALLALLLASIGVYGVLSFAVTERTRELGIRAALGATPRRILHQVLRQGAVLALAGIGLGLVGALAAGRLLRGLLYQVTATDPAILSAVVLLLAAVALLASVVPAWRATRIDPMQALRSE